MLVGPCMVHGPVTGIVQPPSHHADALALLQLRWGRRGRQRRWLLRLATTLGHLLLQHPTHFGLASPAAFAQGQRPQILFQKLHALRWL